MKKAAGQKRGCIGTLAALCDRIAARPSMTPGNGAVTGSDRIDSLFRQSRFAAFFRNDRTVRFLHRFRNRFAARCEGSLVLRFFTGLIHRCLSLSCRSLAAFTGSYSLSACVILVLRYILYDTVPGFSEIATAAALLSFSVPLLFSDSSIFRLFYESRMFGGTFRYMNPSDSLKNRKTLTTEAGVLFFLGLIVGFSSWFYGITPVPLVLCFLVYLFLTLSFPEIGYLIALLSVPFLGFFRNPSITLAVLFGICLISTVFKQLRAKRMPVFPTDSLFFWLLTVGILLAAISPSAYAVRSAALTAVLMLGYVLSLNLFRSEKYLAGACTAMVCGAAVIAAYGIASCLLGWAPYGWTDTTLFPEIGQRAVSLFENPNVLGAYLTAVFPFSLCLISSDRGREYRFLGIFSSVLIVFCALFTWSRNAWIGLFCGMLAYGLLRTPRAVLLIPGTGIAAVTAGFCFPDTFGKRLLHFFSQQDSANSYRVKVWNGAVRSLREVLFCGTGAGDIAFRSVYLQCAVAGTESAPHSHSIYLQLALSFGIVTLLVFLYFVFLLFRKALRGTRDSKAPASVFAAAAFASVFAMLVTGIFDNVFYNYRVMALFFCIAGICSGAGDLGAKPQISAVESDSTQAELLMKF